MNLQQLRTLSSERVDSYLKTSLSTYQAANSLHTAMLYSLFNGGKRVRPMLVYASAQLFGPITPLTDASAAAVEAIHAYSLVHDDLPAMDDDDLRRGQPTCHIKFDEATAILAGDALQTFAFEMLSDASLESAATQIQLVQTLAKASGRHGMVTGQMIDLTSVNQTIDRQTLELMHQHKTGALIKAAIKMGAISAQCQDPKALDALDGYAHAIGLAFQVQDDILDITSDTQTLGKNQFSDEDANKPTYPKLLGLEASKQLVIDLHQQASEQIRPFAEKGKSLVELANYIIHRNH
ncbi:(2E,6E)-farnesyl diphosphate synthase [Marinomonas sp. 15G1-11]|uniref:(2E,6E)-farnesyl diphosphate synthase n=1 Tax=Marinomonas phaeophyticola TaxID=3004091 RepID=A0ABT4JTA3_9GAMM|nr:farnesyl diphosphate synthase [Marinomonas sp. 15G1-11]MCZ2721632.1 (2E,6E)-farnesyl diphosphate synthase [Marinomonas sp. 15G1-11]